MTRDEAIRSLEPTVRAIAGQAHARMPACVPLGDVLQSAWIGAIHAVDHYDKRRGVPLAAFARLRISGEVRDFQRREDPLGRGHRKSIKHGDESEVEFVSVNERCHAAYQDDFSSNITVDKALETPALSERQKRLIFWYYWREKNFREIGPMLGVGPGRVQQIHANAIALMRVHLGRKHETTA